MIAEIIIENAVELAAALLMMLIGVLGSFLSLKLGKRQELSAISAAISEAIGMARLTVDELQQTLVDSLKAAHADGKLTKTEITMLSGKLWEGTREKMSTSAAQLLEAAGVDLRALIQGAGEAWIANMQEKAGV